MTTTLSLHTTETDPAKALEALKRAVDLLTELQTIEGMRVSVTGDIDVRVFYDGPKPAVTNIGPDQQGNAHELAREHAARVAGVTPTEDA